MQDRGSLPGHPGASGYAPGHEMHEKGSRPGHPGTSGYAPGRQGPETTGRGSMGDRDPDRDRGDARERPSITLETQGGSRSAIPLFVWRVVWLA